MSTSSKVSDQSPTPMSLASASDAIKKKLTQHDWEFSRTVGEILEVRQLSETHISGGGTDSTGRVRSISSQTTHFNRCRILWESGSESFKNLSGDYSVGDKVFVVYAKDKYVTDVNIETGSYKTVKSDPTMSGLLGLAFFLCLFLCLFIVGIPLLIGLIIYLKSRTKSFVQKATEFVNHHYSLLSEYFQALKKVPKSLPFTTDFQDKRVPHYWRVYDPKPGELYYYDRAGFHLSTIENRRTARCECPFTALNPITQPYQILAEFVFEPSEVVGAISLSFNDIADDNYLFVIIQSDGWAKLLEVVGQTEVIGEAQLQEGGGPETPNSITKVSVKIVQASDFLDVTVNDRILADKLPISMPDDPLKIDWGLLKVEEDSRSAKVSVVCEKFEVTPVNG